MKLVAGHSDTVNAWISKVHGAHILHQPSETFGVIDDEGVLRGALVTWFKTDATAELSVFGELSNDVVKAYFRWVFGHIHRLEVRTSRRNKAVKKAAPKYGFSYQGRDRDYYGPGDDALVFYMTPEKCRWIDHGLDVQVA